MDDFLIKQNVGRFAGGDTAHRVAWYLYVPYYVVVLGVGMLPWSWFAFLGWPRRGEQVRDDGLSVFCALWAAVVFGLFTLSGSKLPHYVLPAIVPLAMLAARRRDGALFGPGVLLWGIALAIGLNLGLAFYYRESGQEEAHARIEWVKEQGGEVATYQLPRRRSDQGTGRPQIQETSLPSLAFYFGRRLRHAETFEELNALPTPLWIFTRSGRLGAGDAMRFSARGRILKRVNLPVAGDAFEVFRLEPK